MVIKASAATEIRTLVDSLGADDEVQRETAIARLGVIGARALDRSDRCVHEDHRPPRTPRPSSGHSKPLAITGARRCAAGHGGRRRRRRRCGRRPASAPDVPTCGHGRRRARCARRHGPRSQPRPPAQAGRLRRTGGDATRRPCTRRRGAAGRSRERAARRGRRDRRWPTERPRRPRRSGKTRWKDDSRTGPTSCVTRSATAARRRRRIRSARWSMPCGAGNARRRDGTSRVARAPRSHCTRRSPCAAAGWRSTTCARASRTGRRGFRRRSWPPCTSSATCRASNRSPRRGAPPNRTRPRTAPVAPSAGGGFQGNRAAREDHEATRRDETDRGAVAGDSDVGSRL